MQWCESYSYFLSFNQYSYDIINILTLLIAIIFSNVINVVYSVFENNYYMRFNSQIVNIDKRLH